MSDEANRKIVYVLVSSEKDYYFEEFLISYYSLKMYNPKTDVWLITDDVTSQRIEKFLNILNVDVHKVSIDFASSISPRLRSRYIKTSIREIVGGDFLYLDCDTLISGSLEEVFELKTPVNMVLDEHRKLQKEERSKDIEKKVKIFEPSFHSLYDRYFNSGVIFCRDCKEAHDFFDEWNKEYKKSNQYGNLQDQPPLHFVNIKRKCVITEIDGKFNCQMDRGVKYLHDARVIHYLGLQYETNKAIGSLSYLMHEIANKSLFEEYRKKHYVITEDLDRIMHNPKGSIKDSVTVPTDSPIYRILNSNSFLLLCVQNNLFPAWFRLKERILGKQLALYRLLKKKRHKV